MFQFENFQKLGKDNVDLVLRSFGPASKGAQTIAVESADYAKKSFEQGTAAVEKLLAAKSLDKAFEIQTDYMKTAYEGFVAQSTKMAELYQSLAKETFRPFDVTAAKVAK